MSRTAAIAVLLLLGACAKSEEASLVPPQEEGYNMVDPVAAPLATDEVAVGEWSASTQEEQPVLQFGPPQAGPLFSLRCGEEGAVVLQRHGVIQAPGLNTMALEVGGEVQRLPAESVSGAIPLLRATLPADNMIVDRFGQGQGRITVRTGEGEPLIMPASPLIGDFVRGCANGGQGRAAEQPTNSSAPANSAAPANNAATTAAPANSAAQPAGNPAEARPSERRPQ